MATIQNYPPSSGGGGAGGAVQISDTSNNALDSNGAGALKVDGSAVTQPVSAASLPLPTGAATAAKQPALGTAGTPSTDVITVQGITSMTALKVDGSGVTQPVSGTVTANQGGTWNINNVSGTVSLPTGAATAAKQPALGTAGSASTDVITVQGIASMTALKVDGSAVTQPISAASLPLPSGAATAANQTTGNTSLSSIDGKLGSLGQKAMTGSAPVVIASDQSALPTKAAVNTNGSGSAAAATVSTVITLSAPSNAVGFILQCLDTSTANVRWSIGRTASATLGQQLQPGRDTGFIPCGANVSLCAESGTQNYDIQWVSQ